MKRHYIYPPGYSMVQSMLKSNELVKNPLKFISKGMKEFSDSFSFQIIGRKKILFTQDPEFIHHVLVKNHTNYYKSEMSTKNAVRLFGNGLVFSNGDHWLQHRRLLQPSFNRENVNSLFDVMIETISDFVDNFPKGNSIDIYHEMNILAFDIVLNSLFRLDLKTEIIQKFRDILTELQDYLVQEINNPLLKPYFVISGKDNKMVQLSHELKSIIGNIIKKRKESNTQVDDLLQVLLDGKYKDSNKKMAHEDIIDELLILMVAGHETTANTLSWLLHIISTHDDVQDKLYTSIQNNSIKEFLGDQYLIACIYESMRLYPVVWMTERVSIEDDEFNGYSYPKGTTIIPFLFGCSRNEELWERESAFYPDRFLDIEGHPRFRNFFPFGSGPRMCIGQHFAIAEIGFFIHLFLSRFKIESSGHVPSLNAKITLRPDKVLLNIKER